jgi:hypothetical protein
MPETVTPVVVLGDDLQVRIVALLAGKQVGALAAARRRDREAEVEIVLAGEVVILQQILAEARARPSSSAAFMARPVTRPDT